MFKKYSYRIYQDHKGYWIVEKDRGMIWYWWLYYWRFNSEEEAVRTVQGYLEEKRKIKAHVKRYKYY